MNNIDIKIFELIDHLRIKKEISTVKQFCESVGLLEQTVSKMKKGMNHFTVTQIEIICKTYYVNANWIFGTEKKMFLDSKPQQIKDLTGNIADNAKR